MTEAQILDYYNENWNDYNKIMDMLHDIIEAHAEEITTLKDKLNNNSNNNSSTKKIKELEDLLQKCQDRLDEETHTI